MAVVADKAVETVVTRRVFWRLMLHSGAAGASAAMALWQPQVIKFFAHNLRALLTLILAGTCAGKGPFRALCSEWLAAPVAAAGLEQIDALGNLSGFVCNFLIGWIKDETGSFPLALMPIAALALAGTIAVLMTGRGQPRTVAVQQ